MNVKDSAIAETLAVFDGQVRDILVSIQKQGYTQDMAKSLVWERLKDDDSPFCVLYEKYRVAAREARIEGIRGGLVGLPKGWADGMSEDARLGGVLAKRVPWIAADVYRGKVRRKKAKPDVKIMRQESPNGKEKSIADEMFGKFQQWEKDTQGWYETSRSRYRQTVEMFGVMLIDDGVAMMMGLTYGEVGSIRREMEAEGYVFNQMNDFVYDVRYVEPKKETEWVNQESVKGVLAAVSLLTEELERLMGAKGK